MPCSLCGGKHNLRSCSLPGAAKHRELLSQVRHVAGKIRNPQEGRKPPRLGAVTWGKRKKKASADYSGPGKRRRDRKADNLRRRKGPPLAETPAGQLQAVSLLQEAGFTPRMTRCSHCKWSLGQAFVYKGKHVYKRCINSDCRKRTNVLTAAKWLQNARVRQVLSPMQMHSLLLAYTSTHLAAPPSPYVLARTIGSSYKPVSHVLSALRDVESGAGKKANDQRKISGPLELDATSLRKIRVGPKTQKYSALVEQWKKTHRGRPGYHIAICEILCLYIYAYINNRKYFLGISCYATDFFRHMHTSRCYILV